jgi:uncharacterized protein YjdB
MRMFGNSAAYGDAGPRIGVRRLAGTAMACALLTACGGEKTDTPPVVRPATVATVRLSPDISTLVPNDTLQLRASVLDVSGNVISGRTVTWTSAQPTLATVSQTGVVKAVAVGSATITGSVEGFSGTTTIVIAPPVSARCDVTQTIAVGETVNGTISGIDCQLADTSFAKKYALTLTDSTPLRIAMSSNIIDSYLILQNAVTGAVVAENDDGNGGQGSRIDRVLGPGRYVVLATTFGPRDFGDFNLSVARGTPSCINPTAFTVPGTVNGTLATSACILGDSSYTDKYAFSVTTSTIVTLTMRSTAFDSFLFLESTSGELIGRNDDGGGGLDSRLVETLKPGSYIINANSSDPKVFGAYTLTAESRPDVCASDRVLAPGSAIVDTLRTTSCALNNGTYARRFRFTVSAATALRLDLTSTQFDPYLIVQPDGTATPIAEDDDGGSGLNSQILTVFPTGTYVVTVTSARAGEVGAFTLSLTGATTPPVSVSVNPTTATMTPGQAQQLTASVVGGTNTNVSWKSSAPGIATVTSTGVVRAITAGSATITVTSTADAARTASTSITVGATTSLNLDIPFAYLTQSVQTADGRVPLIANRETIARVFVRSSRTGAGTFPVRLRFFNGTALLATLTGTATAGSPVDEACCSADLLVPASALRDGVTMIADVDPDNATAEANETDNAWPLTGASKPIRLVTTPTINVQLVPIRHRASGLTGPSGTEITSLLRRMYPLSQLNVTVHAEYATDLPPLANTTNWTSMLRQIEALRSLEASSAYYFGVLNQASAPGIVGIAGLGGYSGLGVSSPIGDASETLTHEFGHMFGRSHAPTPSSCGVPAGVDPSFPRSDGTLGVFGFDVGTRVSFRPEQYDIMGYCDNTWASTYTYLGILEYLRSGAVPTAQVIQQQTTPVLLMSGSLSSGRIEIDPAFAIAAPATKQRVTGQFIAEGFAADGRVLFRHQFDGRQIPDADASDRIFQIAVPYDEAARGPIDRVSIRTTTGTAVQASLARESSVGAPGGVNVRVDADPQLAARRSGSGEFELSWNASKYPALVVRNRRTNAVIGIGSRGSMTINAATLDDLDALISNGVSSVTRRIGTGAP